MRRRLRARRAWPPARVSLDLTHIAAARGGLRIIDARSCGGLKSVAVKSSTLLKLVYSGHKVGRKDQCGDGGIRGRQLRAGCARQGGSCLSVPPSHSWRPPAPSPATRRGRGSSASLRPAMEAACGDEGPLTPPTGRPQGRCGRRGGWPTAFPEFCGEADRRRSEKEKKQRN
jgi:hypothetical protein